ncbi:MAG: NAD(+)/NADH kinase [Thermoguttaceae bacterium]|nr:NAD(+)/NADH kinase [Thermoguttaceae bacterium]
MRVIILGYQNRPGVPETVQALRPTIENHARIVLEDLTGKVDLSCVEADIALVFGGDGSILRAVQQMGKHQIPLLAVNLGRLGFLAELSRDDDLIAVLEKLTALERAQGPKWLESLRKNTFSAHGESLGGFSISRHRLLNCTVRKDVGMPSEMEISSLVMNETAIQSAEFHIIELRIWADEECVTTCRCDGIILATPIGSTAHNLSVGGPILRPGLDAVVISPIAPHTLTFRPIVDSSLRKYRFNLTSERTKTAVVVDGNQIAEITLADQVEITPSPIEFEMLNVPGFSYYLKLQKKLGWGGHLG